MEAPKHPRATRSPSPRSRTFGLAFADIWDETGHMAEILLFHHAHGLTPGLRALADRLRAHGHSVYTPDAYGGKTLDDLDEGVKHAQSIGHDAMADVAHRAARAHRKTNVVIGFSLGTAQAQQLAQDLRRVRGCLLMGGALPPQALGGDWRHEVDLQIHVADPDEWVDEEEINGLLFHAPHAKVFTYPGQGHMFVDPSSPDYDADAAALFEERTLAWLAHIDSAVEAAPDTGSHHTAHYL